jgi:hypothetical protein
MNQYSEPSAKDKLYDENMRCGKSYDGRHHFVPVRSAKREIQHIQCSYCRTLYDATLHNPPEGYTPHYTQ